MAGLSTILKMAMKAADEAAPKAMPVDNTGLKNLLQSDDKIEEFQKVWKSSPENKFDQRQAQDVDVREAVEQFDKGELTGKKLRNIIKEKLPMEMIDSVQKIPSFSDMIGALNKSQVKSGIVGLNKSLRGQRVATRLDIPAYNRHDTWIVSIHESMKGKAIGYGKTARLKNVEFGSQPRTAIDIAQEKLKPDSKKMKQAKEEFFLTNKRKPNPDEIKQMRADPSNMSKTDKSTIARMEGDWTETPDSDTISFAENLFKRQKDGKFFDEAGEEWIQVGMNPYRGSNFYDKATGQALQAADEVIQVGPLVFAKGARKPTLSEYKKNFTFKDTQGKTKVFNRGGMVARNPYPEARGIY